MYHYEFILDRPVVDEHRITMSVVLESDTGFYDKAGAEQTDLRSFAPVEESGTRLRFVIGKNTWHSNFKEFALTAAKAVSPPPRYTDGEGGILTTMAFPITDFIDEASTRQALAHFVAHCQ